MRPPIVIFNGCGSRIWTYDLLVMSQVSCRTALFRVDAGAGLEPATFSLWGWRATTCSTPHGDPKENRTPAFAVKGRRLKPLDYGARFQDLLPQILSFYPSVLALLSANNFDLSTGYWLLPYTTRPALLPDWDSNPIISSAIELPNTRTLGSERTHLYYHLIIYNRAE